MPKSRTHKTFLRRGAPKPRYNGRLLRRGVQRLRKARIIIEMWCTEIAKIKIGKLKIKMTKNSTRIDSDSYSFFEFMKEHLHRNTKLSESEWIRAQNLDNENLDYLDFLDSPQLVRSLMSSFLVLLVLTGFNMGVVFS